MALNQRTSAGPPDALLTFGLITIDAVETQNGDTIDLQSAGYSAFDVVLNVATIDVASTDELYTLALQLGDDSSFTNSVERACLRLGASGELAANTADSTTGRYVIGADNVNDGTGYRYARVVVTGAGTTPALTVSGYISPSGGVGQSG